MKKKIVSAMGFGEGRTADERTLPMIFAVLLIIILSIIIDLWVRGPAISYIALFSGLFVFLVGLMVRTAGYLNLGKQFTLEVKRVPGHRLITSGIHAYIRHPMYTGLFMIMVGFCLALQSIAGVIATLLLLVPAGMYRIKIEEDFLLKEFGSEYKRYMKKTKKLIPFVW